MIARNAVFSKNANARKAFSVSIVLVDNLLKGFICILFYLALRFAGLDLNNDGNLLFFEIRRTSI